MTHGHGQQDGDCLRELGEGLSGGGQRGKNGNNCNSINMKKRIEGENVILDRIFKAPIRKRYLNKNLRAMREQTMKRNEH